MSSTKIANSSVSKNGRTVRVALPVDAIVIDEIKIGNGRPIRGGQLFGCYFVQEGKDYDLFDRDGTQLKSQIQHGVPFNFSFPDNSEPDAWQMTVKFGKKDLRDVANGDWNFLGKPHNDGDNDDDDDADEEDGTFHAQAGGGMKYEKASSATAY